MAMITAEQVAAAYAALATGQRDQIAQVWAEDLRWLVPGHNQLSGWKSNLDEFIQFMGTVGRLSDNSFRMDSVAVMAADNFSADVTRNTGNRAGHGQLAGVVEPQLGYGPVDQQVQPAHAAIPIGPCDRIDEPLERVGVVSVAADGLRRQREDSLICRYSVAIVPAGSRGR